MLRQGPFSNPVLCCLAGFMAMPRLWRTKRFHRITDSADLAAPNAFGSPDLAAYSTDVSKLKNDFTSCAYMAQALSPDQQQHPLGHFSDPPAHHRPASFD